MSYLDEMVKLPTDISGELIHSPQAAEIAARADAQITELQQSVEIRDTEIARLETDLEVARMDAERWRKLRAMNWTQKDAFAVVDVSSLKLGTLTYTHDRLDEAIEARAGNGGGA